MLTKLFLYTNGFVEDARDAPYINATLLPINDAEMTQSPTYALPFVVNMCANKVLHGNANTVSRSPQGIEQCLLLCDAKSLHVILITHKELLPHRRQKTFTSVTVA